MRPLPIAQIGEPVLRAPTTNLRRNDLLRDTFQAFIDQLIATMRHASGAGLAANQVSRSVSVCVIEVGDNPRYPYKPKIPLTVLVNPHLTPVSDESFDNYEGCLSVPNLRGIVPRYAEVRVTGWNRHGHIIDCVVRGITAGTFQHEVDHLSGTLFVDRVADTRTLCTWDTFTRHHEAAFRERVRGIVARYGS
ncbi:MAG: peptide deformylase [Nannocystaceae bacterium]